MRPSRHRHTLTPRLALAAGAATGSVGAALWTLGTSSGPQETAAQALSGLVVGTLVSIACVSTWTWGLPRWVVHGVGMITCWASATGLLAVFTGNIVGSAAYTLPSLVLGLAITYPVLTTLEIGAQRASTP